jgi:uncharacterized protein (DUF427 family)
VAQSERVATRPAVRIEPAQRRVRTEFNGVTVADTRRALLVWERQLPVYYFRRDDVRDGVLVEAGERHDPGVGAAKLYSVQVGDRVAERAAWSRDQLAAGDHSLAGHVTFDWKAMDAWYEEDDEVFVHARDPYHRVDVLRSSRHVRVVVLGQTVAETRRPSLLFETGLPVRTYVPRADVLMDLLVPSDTRTQCPYKGVASYYSVKVGNQLVRDLVWSYRYPIPECPRIQDLVCFFDEQVDAVIVDGEEVAKPRTPWSRAPVIETLA